ncbi:c7f7f49c-5f18-429c-8852-05b4f799627c [Sclerotinia trifoliorum]|uniref:C7f7f49c-5f18-429c-8852-05b4f799627c n=1 Tax=Sclerotinia trifoliorum TaxID=28548 RepID=A0A8H2VNB5_9HELO|nr:c7f7f49c-5f18-429c-8852-05b4f799627c [Sclerotinia trifoliorum]
MQTISLTTQILHIPSLSITQFMDHHPICQPIFRLQDTDSANVNVPVAPKISEAADSGSYTKTAVHQKYGVTIHSPDLVCLARYER